MEDYTCKECGYEYYHLICYKDRYIERCSRCGFVARSEVDENISLFDDQEKKS